MKLPIYSNVAEAKMLPKLIQIKNNLIVVSFEWMKIMTVHFVIKELLKNGKIKPGDTVIDSSSGVYAYSLALVCKQFGLKCVIVGSSAVNEALKLMLELIGTTVYIIPAETPKDSELNRINFIKKFLSKHPQTIWMGQYFNKDHYEGYQLLADILLNSIEKKFTLITAVGSGCSAGGTISYLRKHFDAKLIGVERFGSQNFGLLPSNDFSNTITGVGASILMPNVTAADFDVIHWLDAKLSAYGAMRLYQETGIFGGHSTGAVYQAAEWESSQAPDELFVCISADQGYRYIDSIYNAKTVNTILSSNYQNIQPKKVMHPKDALLPWSVMNWNRKNLNEYINLKDINDGNELWT